MKARHQHSRRSLAVAGLITLAVVATLLAAWSNFLAPPSVKDYQRASSLTKELRSSTTQVDQVTAKYVQTMITSLRLDPTGKRMADDAKADRGNYDAAFKEYDDLVKDLNAASVSRDDSIKPMLDAVNKQSQRFRVTFDGLVGAYPAYYTTVISCDDVDRFIRTNDAAKNANAFKAASEDCISDFQELGEKSKIKGLAEYAKGRRALVVEQNSVYQALAKPGVNSAAQSAKLAGLNARVTLYDPLGIIKREREEALSVSAFDTLIKQLDSKSKS